MIRLNAQPLQVAECWLESYRPFWSISLDRLDSYTGFQEDSVT